ncbi:MAG: O-antigen ligase family protein [bacterium]|nr:MAG: O-antigen ligase family protein [bacterium]
MIYKPQNYPWASLLILSVLFFLIIGHELDFSLKAKFDASGEAFEEMIREGNPLRRVGLAILGLYSTFLLFYRQKYRNLSVPGTMGILVVILISWSAISLFWSIDPGLTSRRLLVLLVFWLTAISYSANFPIRYLLYFAILSTGLYIMIGFSAELVYGTLQPFSASYRFAGTVHPNVQGESCAILFLASVALSMNSRNYRSYLMVLIVIALAFLVLSRSRTSFVSALLALFIFYIIASPLSLRKMIVLVSSMLLFVLLIFLSVNFFDNNFSLITSGIHLGRDTYTLDTLNGRMKIWNLCLQFVKERPLIGHGYEGFWNLTHIYRLSSLVGWGLKSAHSAYIELLLHLGLIGFFTFISMLVVALKNALQRFFLEKQAGYSFLFMLIVFFIFQGLLESRLAQMGFGTFILMWGISALAFVNRRETA